MRCLVRPRPGDDSASLKALSLVKSATRLPGHSDPAVCRNVQGMDRKHVREVVSEPGTTFALTDKETGRRRKRARDIITP
jgi:hypothetical protein